jgi:hypothetical protein
MSVVMKDAIPLCYCMLTWRLPFAVLLHKMRLSVLYTLAQVNTSLTHLFVSVSCIFQLAPTPRLPQGVKQSQGLALLFFLPPSGSLERLSQVCPSRAPSRISLPPIDLLCFGALPRRLTHHSLVPLGLLSWHSPT